MLIPILVLLIFTFSIVYFIFISYKLAIMALVNLAMGGIIILRAYHDIYLNKRYKPYIISAMLTMGLIAAGISTFIPKISKFLARFALLEIVQVLIPIFLMAQILIYATKKHN